jgi:hypothetical protein
LAFVRVANTVELASKTTSTSAGKTAQPTVYLKEPSHCIILCSQDDYWQSQNEFFNSMIHTFAMFICCDLRQMAAAENSVEKSFWWFMELLMSLDEVTVHQAYILHDHAWLSELTWLNPVLKLVESVKPAVAL